MFTGEVLFPLLWNLIMNELLVYNVKKILGYTHDLVFLAHSESHNRMGLGEGAKQNFIQILAFPKRTKLEGPLKLRAQMIQLSG